jgi:hypothetical protein
MYHRLEWMTTVASVLAVVFAFLSINNATLLSISLVMIVLSASTLVWSILSQWVIVPSKVHNKSDLLRTGDYASQIYGELRKSNCQYYVLMEDGVCVFLNENISWGCLEGYRDSQVKVTDVKVSGSYGIFYVSPTKKTKVKMVLKG